MLVIRRGIGDAVLIGEGDSAIRLIVLGVQVGGEVALGFEAPREIPIRREETRRDG